MRPLERAMQNILTANTMTPDFEAPLMELKKLLADMLEACKRLHAHRVKIETSQKQGAPFEVIESTMSAQRSLARHLEHMRMFQLQPLVVKVELARQKSLPACIARLENRLAELRGMARKRLEDDLVEILAAAMACGCKIGLGGHSLDFKDSGLGRYLKEAQSRHLNSDATTLEQEIVQRRFEADHGTHTDSTFESLFNGVVCEAMESCGFDASKDFFALRS